MSIGRLLQCIALCLISMIVLQVFPVPHTDAQDLRYIVNGIIQLMMEGF